MKKFCFTFMVLLILLAAGCQQSETPDTSQSVVSSSSTVSSEQSQPASREEQHTEADQPEIFFLKDKLPLEPEELLSFQYEELSAQEERSVTLTGEDGIRAMESLLAFQVSVQEPGEEDPITGGAKRYTMEFSSGETVVVYDTGMISINEEENIYKREGNESLVLPENPSWTTYHVDLITGEKTILEAPASTPQS